MRSASAFLYSGTLSERLRYGENPHQGAAFYVDQQVPAGSLAAARQLQGKALSYNNIADSDAALECVKQFDRPGLCDRQARQSLRRRRCRQISWRPTRKRSKRTRRLRLAALLPSIGRWMRRRLRLIIERQFVEVIVAPAIAADAAAVIAAKKNVRVLETGDWAGKSTPGFDFKKVNGGLLVQNTDLGVITADDLNVVTKIAPTAAQIQDMLFAWTVVKYVKSNAIIFCKDNMTIGVGAGQMSRVYSTRIAAIKAADEGLEVKGSVMASDAFFPFRDGIDAAAEHGIAAIIQPGGSMRDQEVIDAANEHQLAMVFTGMRHFRH